MSRSRRAAAGVLLLLAAAAPLGAIAPVDAAGSCATPVGVYAQGTPWPQRLLDPSRVWASSDGRGQLVAVLGTGIDPANAQFRTGQVHAPLDPVAPAPATADCDGRGTAAAGIIGAQPDDRTTFEGVAPGADLLPVRYTQTVSNSSSSAPAPSSVAAAIRAATQAKADVVLVVVPATVDSAELRQATAAALAAGEVVVSPASAGQAGARTYPTAYAGVLGVGGIDQDGAATQVESGADVLIVAPGKGLVSTAAGARGRVGNAYPLVDPSFAAAFVAGSVALLRGSDPQLTPAQVVARLLATAERPAGGGRDARLGWGTVDPVAAVSSVLPSTVPSPTSAPGATARGRIVPLSAPPPAGPPDRTPGLLTVAGLLVAVAVVAAATAVRRARSRGWRPGRRPRPGTPGQTGRQGDDAPMTTSASGTRPTSTPRS